MAAAFYILTIINAVIRFSPISAGIATDLPALSNETTSWCADCASAPDGITVTAEITTARSTTLNPMYSDGPVCLSITTGRRFYEEKVKAGVLIMCYRLSLVSLIANGDVFRSCLLKNGIDLDDQLITDTFSIAPLEKCGTVLTQPSGEVELQQKLQMICLSRYTGGQHYLDSCQPHGVTLHLNDTQQQLAAYYRENCSLPAGEFDALTQAEGEIVYQVASTYLDCVLPRGSEGVLALLDGTLADQLTFLIYAFYVLSCLSSLLHIVGVVVGRSVPGISVVDFGVINSAGSNFIHIILCLFLLEKPRLLRVLKIESDETFVFNEIKCEVLSFLYISTRVYAHFVFALYALERYMVISFPLQFKAANMNIAKVAKMLGGVMLVAVVAALALYLYTRSRLITTSVEGVCVIYPLEASGTQMIPIIIWTGIFQILPWMADLVLCICVMYELGKARRFRAQFQENTSRNHLSSTSVKLSWLLINHCLCHIVCTLPEIVFYSLSIVRQFLPIVDPRISEAMYIGAMLSPVLMMLASLPNSMRYVKGTLKFIKVSFVKVLSAVSSWM